MIFTNMKLPNIVKIAINDSVLEIVRATKFLGVLIDEKLTWMDKISSVANKISKVIGVLYKCRNLVTKEAMITLYNSLILPYFMYCCPVWVNTYKTKLQPLVIIQKRALRLICNANRFCHTNGLFHATGIFKFHDIVNLSTAVVMYQAYHSMLPEKLQGFFQIRNAEGGYITRQSNKFNQKLVRTTLRTKCISIVGLKLWNNFPTDAPVSGSIRAFKTYYKSLLLQKYSE